MSYSDKAREYLSTQSNGKLVSQVLPSITPVSVSEGGHRKTVPVKDSVTRFETLSTNIFRPSSSFDTMLVNQSPVDVNIKMSTISGKIYDMIILFIVNNNTGADVELTPLPGWFQRIEFIMGTNPVQQFFPEDLFNYLWLMELNEWTRISDLFGMDDQYLPRRDVLSNGDQKIYLLTIPGNFFKETGLVGGGLNQDLLLRLYMGGTSETVVSGLPPQVNDVRVQFITNQILESNKIAAINTMRIGNYCTRYYWPVRQQYTRQNVGPNTRIDEQLSSFNGLFNLIQFCITVANPVGLDRYTQYPVKLFDVLDENGQSIWGQAAGQFSEESQWWDGFVANPLSEFDDTHYVYKWIASTAVKQDLVNGTSNGSYYFNGRARLMIDTGDLRVAKVITITEATAFVAASGQFRILYSSNLSGQLEVTPWLAFNATAAAIKAAIELLPTFAKFQQTVTVSNSLDNAPITITYDIIGDLAYDEGDDKALLVIESNVRDAGGVEFGYNSAITQNPQDGWPGNPFSYTITIMGTQLSCMDINEQGTTNISKS